MAEEKRMIRIWYTQPGPGSFTERYFTPLLSRRWQVVLDREHPDYVISSCFGMDKRYRKRGAGGTHFDYPDVVKIFYTGENVVPDFNLFDYAIGFDRLDFGDRYIRYPLWLFYLREMGTERREPVTMAEAIDRKFCNFVYSNNWNSDPMRRVLFERLSARKPVDSGGRYLNNMGGRRVEDKLAFLREYKFTIAAENSMVDGYTTEKLIEPLMMGSIPIYWGNPQIEAEGEFNPQALIRVEAGEKGIEKAVEEAIRLDRDNEAYWKKLNQPIFAGKSVEQMLGDYEEKLLDFFASIFDRPKGEARRRAVYGFNRRVTRDRERMQRSAETWLFKKWHGLKDKIRKRR
jgi:hypothetical protein